MMSFKVVTNGPVAKAGFTLKRFIIKGTKVPKNEAHKITVNKATLTVAANAQDSLINKLYPKINPEQINPLIKPTPSSLNNLGAILQQNVYHCLLYYNI